VVSFELVSHQAAHHPVLVVIPCPVYRLTMVKTKVFVGNLSFKTGEKDLVKEFEAAGKVASANVISRGSRSLGYGFVEMESEEEANKAVELLHKKLIDNREINVEVARPREENPNGNNNKDPNAAPKRAPRKFFRRKPNEGNNGQQGQVAQGGAAPNNNNAGPSNGQQGQAPQGAQQGGARGGRPPRRQNQPRQPRAPRPERPERVPKTAPPNSVFVANLPFSVDDAGLAEIFTKLGLKDPVKSSHVVKERQRYSKGFGFVEFASADDQQKALTANNLTVNDRQIIVKAAFTELPPAKAPGSPSAQPAAATTNETEVKA